MHSPTNAGGEDVAELRRLVDGAVKDVVSEHGVRFLRALPPLLADHEEVRLHHIGQQVLDPRHLREVGHVEGVDLARAEGLVVAGDVVEGGEREVVEDEVAVERVGV